MLTINQLFITDRNGYEVTVTTAAFNGRIFEVSVMSAETHYIPSHYEFSISQEAR